VIKDQAEIFKHTTMLNGTLKLEKARLSERYHMTAWNLAKLAYFKLLGNCQLSDPSIKDVIKVAWNNWIRPLSRVKCKQ
jgi:hypothetical protein